MRAVYAAPPPRVALVPNAIAFRDPSRGLLGTGWAPCGSNSGFGCHPQGTISLTSDGGRTWKVVLRTARPVVAVGTFGATDWATFDDGEYLTSVDRGRTWHPTPTQVPRQGSPCPGDLANVVTTPRGKSWALCTTEGGVGSMGKSVYRFGPRGWRRVAYTPFAPTRPGGYGGISLYGYPLGIAMADDGFGVIWESRGTLYVTRDGGSHWLGLPKVAKPEVDFGFAGATLPHGVGFVVLSRGGGEIRRLIATHDAGRTWRVVHVWR
jgi:photosystem II stability/assembly factor-like uncharacterized protein